MISSTTFVKATKSIVNASKILFTPIALAFLVFFSWQAKEQLTSLFSSANIEFIIASLLLWIFLQLFSPIFTLLIFRGWNIAIPYKELLLIHTNRLPAKYIPGGVWHTVARGADYKYRGLNGRQLAFYFLLEAIVVASVTLALGGTTIILFQQEHSIILIGIYAASLVSMLALLAAPRILAGSMFADSYAVPPQNYWLSITFVAIFWMIAALSFVFFIGAFSELQLTDSPIVIAGIYIFSWGVGYITLFAPQGLGVSEYMAAHLISSNLSLGYFMALLAGFRILIVIADISAWLLAKICLIEKQK
ncbi:MAG: hypothetical protein P1U80_08010 [Pseudomonadales bacterium]|nr:hypothetical protein [Pseudomonadales bacterium]